jgi:hypothetical protein
MRPDLDGMRAAVGIDEPIDRLTHADLQKRRELIRKRFEEKRARR